jgi:diguanylate cyclase (GGDEF)-like protein
MSLRRRLTLFFLALVALPLIVVAVLLVEVTEGSRDDSADASLDVGLEAAETLYDPARVLAADQAARIAGEVAPLIRRGDGKELSRLVAAAVPGFGVVMVVVTDTQGRPLARAGPPVGIASESSAARLSGGRSVGRVEVAALTPSGYLDQLSRLTGQEGAIVSDQGLLGSTTDVDIADLPGPGEERTDLELDDGAVRAAALRLDGAPEGSRVVLLAPREGGFVASEPLVAVILALFFAAAFVLIWLLLRSLQRRVGTMLEAARRIGAGDFSGEVPVEGNDEMAGLAREFNKMNERLAASVQRIGEAFASGLDRRALLELVTQTAATACDARAGRVVLHDSPDAPAVLGTEDSPPELEGVLDRAGTAAAENAGYGDAHEGDLHAMASAIMERRDETSVLCTIAVARSGRPFEQREREVLRYLLRQAVVSIENIGLHERVAAQAITDDLTGIPNYRHFSQWIEQEIARIARFGGELSLVLIDIDNFKAVNDTYGHLLGDAVLEEMGRLLRIESRGIDLAARYGGEEFVLALPETSADGAAEVAERLRRRIEATRVEIGKGQPPIKVTASLGVANLPADAADVHSLIGAADAALYHAKHEGKNRVSRVDALPDATAQGKPPERRS